MPVPLPRIEHTPSHRQRHENRQDKLVKKDGHVALVLKYISRKCEQRTNRPFKLLLGVALDQTKRAIRGNELAHTYPFAMVSFAVGILRLRSGFCEVRTSRSVLIRSNKTDAGSYSRPSRRANSASVGTSSPRNALARMDLVSLSARKLPSLTLLSMLSASSKST